MKELIRDQCGAVSAWLLVLMPLFIIMMTGVVEVSRSAHATLDLQQALECAVRAAAMCAEEASQANGDVRIDPGRADEAFRKYLASNLGLDETTLAPFSGSGVASAPAYQLAIINGVNPYVDEGVLITDDSGYSTVPVATGALPVTVGISDIGIDLGGTGEHQTTFIAPGCIAVVKVHMKSTLSSLDFETVRWAAARLKSI